MNFSFCGLLLTLFFASFGLRANISASLDMTEAVVGDHINLSVTVEGDLDTELELPQVKNLDVVGQSSSSSVSIINGSMSKKQVYSYTLVPEKPGDYKIPAIKAYISGGVYKTKPLTLKVGAASDRAYQQDGSQTDDEAPLAFVTRTLSKDKVSLGEPIISTIKFYYQIDVQNLEARPSKSNFFRYFDFKQENKRERYQGKVYNVLVLRRLLMPIKSGEITLDPFLLNAQLLLPRDNSGRQQRRNSLFDFFGESRFKVVQRTFATKDAPVVIAAVPSANRPKDYKGLVGTFMVTASLSEDELKVGDTTTLTITMKGLGSLNTVTPPKLNLPKSIKVYADKPESTEKLDRERGILSQKVFKYALVPTKKGDIDLGSYGESFFDPRKKSFFPLKAALGILKVEPGESSTVVAVGSNSAGGMAKKNVKSLSHDLIDLKRDIPVNSFVNKGLDFDRVLFYLTCFLTLFYLLMLIFSRMSFLSPKMTAKRRRNLAYKIYKEKRNKILRSTESSSSSDQSKLAEKSSFLFKEFIANKFNLNGSSLTIKEVRESLRKEKFDADTEEKIFYLLKNLDEISFGYAQISKSTNKKNLETIHQLVKKVESHV